MKRKYGKIGIIAVIAAIIVCTSCASTPVPKSIFETQSGLNVVVPMRFYTWVKNEYSAKVQPDISNNKISFTYDTEGTYLVKIEKTETGINSIWGTQVMLQDEILRNSMLFTPFISSIYALSENKDPIDIAFDVLKQILSDEMYKAREESLTSVLKNGIQEYRVGGESWLAYKNIHFKVENNTVMLIE